MKHATDLENALAARGLEFTAADAFTDTLRRALEAEGIRPFRDSAKARSRELVIDWDDNTSIQLTIEEVEP